MKWPLASCLASLALGGSMVTYPALAYPAFFSPESEQQAPLQSTSSLTLNPPPSFVRSIPYQPIIDVPVSSPVNYPMLWASSNAMPQTLSAPLASPAISPLSSPASPVWVPPTLVPDRTLPLSVPSSPPASFALSLPLLTSSNGAVPTSAEILSPTLISPYAVPSSSWAPPKPIKAPIVYVRQRVRSVNVPKTQKRSFDRSQNDYDYEEPTYDFLAASLFYETRGCEYAPRWCASAPFLAGFYRFFSNPLLFFALLPEAFEDGLP